MTRREQIEKLCGLDRELYPLHGTDTSVGRLVGAQDENTRLLPIITLILEENEKLRGALKSAAQKSYDISCESATTEMSRDELVMLECRLTKAAHHLWKDLKQVLASSPLDELLEGEK